MKRTRRVDRFPFIVSRQFPFLFLWFAGIVLGARASLDGQRIAQPNRRSATVADAIEMTRWADESYFLGASPGQVGLFSPDRKRFIIGVKRGDMERNTTDYSLLLYRTGNAHGEPKVRTLITMSSSSNREAIKGVKWLKDNETVVFLGENPGQTPDVYSLDVKTNRLSKLTNHPTAITAYGVSEDGATIVYEADAPAKKTVDTEEARRNGIVITMQYPSDLLIGDCNYVEKSDAAYKEVFVQKRGRTPSRVAMRDFVMDLLPLSVSPNGQFALLAPYLAEVPGSWSQYEDRLLQPYVTALHKPGTKTNIQQYMLLDTESLQIGPLLDAPMSWYNRGIAWNDDGTSVVLSGIHLPLDGISDANRDARIKHAFVAEIKVPSKEITEVTDEALRVTKWDEKTGELVLEPAGAGGNKSIQVYEKTGSTWTRVIGAGQSARSQYPLEVSLEEDVNASPKVFVADEKTHRKTLLLDLNPQFDQIQFGNVEAVEWKATDGHQVNGGLYLPPNYTPGTRYPLVIQTHGFDKDRFWIDGPYSSAFAAQPLAALGFVVLQVGGSSQRGEDAKYVNTPQEAPRQMAAYEGAIDYLDGRGLINRTRVGIIGFSRTVFYVEYTLTHSQYPIIAATLADGFDGGYVNYVLWGGRVDYSAVIGGPPVGASLPLWLTNSPGFNLDKVTAAVRIEDYGSVGPLEGWEWFSGLVNLTKPVDFIWLPFAPHLLVKPWERLTSLQGNVDWFAFWLKGEEAGSQTKRRQYDRWRELRKLQEKNQGEKSLQSPTP
jgi:dipeptidyl aminopeptidase/acylaminoacyl peptidase